MKVLIVDDDSAVVDFFCQVLEMRDITDPDTAGSGEEAMGRVATNSTTSSPSTSACRVRAGSTSSRWSAICALTPSLP